MSIDVVTLTDLVNHSHDNSDAVSANQKIDALLKKLGYHAKPLKKGGYQIIKSKENNK